MTFDSSRPDYLAALTLIHQQITELASLSDPISDRWRPIVQQLDEQVTDLTTILQHTQAHLKTAIAQQQRLEELLQITQTKNRALLQAIPDLIMRISIDGVYLDFIEAQNMEILTATAAERLGKNIDEVLPAELAQQYRQAIQQALATADIHSFEYQLAIHDNLRDYEARVVACGETEALLIVRDITQRKQMERALRLEQEKSERLLLNILPRSIAEQLKQQQVSIANRFEEATILFADLVNFTQLSAELSPIELVDLLNQIFSAFDQLADQHGLEKIKTIGDAYMVVSGIPEPQPNHAEAIAEMALDMQQAINQIRWHGNHKLQLRIGINTGAVIAGVIGLKKFIYDLWGDAVNIASRMESHGIAGGIQVTATTHKYLKHKYTFQERGLIEIKGKGKMQVYLLTGRSVLLL